MSQVEQIALTINIALRRDVSTLDYHRAGSSPDAFATLPREWTADQIRSFQDYFDALMSGNLARRRQTKFMPADFRLIETRQPPLKDQYDEWLARRPVVKRPPTPAVPEVRTKREHFLDRLRRLPSRVDIHDLEFRLGERLDLLAVRFDRRFGPTSFLMIVFIALLFGAEP